MDLYKRGSGVCPKETWLQHADYVVLPLRRHAVAKHGCEKIAKTSWRSPFSAAIPTDSRILNIILSVLRDSESSKDGNSQNRCSLILNASSV
jgi:hypothetical protein